MEHILNTISKVYLILESIKNSKYKYIAVINPKNNEKIMKIKMNLEDESLVDFLDTFFVFLATTFLAFLILSLAIFFVLLTFFEVTFFFTFFSGFVLKIFFKIFFVLILLILKFFMIRWRIFFFTYVGPDFRVFFVDF